MISDVRLDRKGIREVLLTGFVDEINELAEDMSEGSQVWPGRPDVYHCGGALTVATGVGRAG